MNWQFDPESASRDLDLERTRLSKEALKRDFLGNLFFVQGKFPTLATMNDYYLALAHTVRDRMLHRWISTASAYTEGRARTVAYLSAEFLMGAHLGNNLMNLGIQDSVREVMEELGLSLDELLAEEHEPGLGNGGLGRLAACYLDSLATLEVPALGYGIRYEFGIFEQQIVDGWQVEKTDRWLRSGNPWEIIRPEWTQSVGFGGHTETWVDASGRSRVRWIPAKVVNGVPYDTPILGHRNNTANTLRLWKSEAPESFDFEVFNRGDYYGAVREKISSETISKVLYPNDDQPNGKELRLEQQYFFVSCSLKDMLRILEVQEIPVDRFHEKFAAQLNDTHPAIAVVELMRLLVDEHGMPFDDAWQVTRKTFAYTNHTLLPEALEEWPLELFGRVLPRHLEIIYDINLRFLDEARVRFFGDVDRIRRMSLINEEGGRSVRMAHLACAGSHAINGVAELHTRLLKQNVLRDFHDLWPAKFQNKTNGVTPRRWIVLSNPDLAGLVTEAIGSDWIHDLEQVRKLEPLAEDAGFREAWLDVKLRNKERLADYVRDRTGIVIDPASMYDCQVKRIHEYKRQHLGVLHIVHLYRMLKSDPGLDVPPRTFVFGGKAAPGYHAAKRIIKLITSVADVINRDVAVRERLRVVFVPNFNVETGQRIYPAADLSEQISMAGKEASGTGNMKFAMNGALTIGTLDGANIEIRDAVGPENFFLFGLDADEVARVQARGHRPEALYRADEDLKVVLDLIREGFFSHGDRDLFSGLVDGLLHHDPYLVLADFRSYVERQQEVSEVFADRDEWARRSILNAARVGHFSSDRSIRSYCDEIWRVSPVPIRLLAEAEVKSHFLQ